MAEKAIDTFWVLPLVATIVTLQAVIKASVQGDILFTIVFFIGAFVSGLITIITFNSWARCWFGKAGQSTK